MSRVCVKILVRFVVTGYADSPQKHICATLSASKMPAVTCSSTVHTERNVVFALQQWLRERAALPHHSTLYCFVAFHINVEAHQECGNC